MTTVNRRTFRQAATLGLDTPATQISLGAAYAHAGQDSQARTILEQLRTSHEHVSPGELAILLAALGERGRPLRAAPDAGRRPR